MDTRKYRTRQEVRKTINPKGKDYIVAVDVGYSGTKVFYEGGYFCFPSYAKKITNGMLSIDNDKDILYREADSEDVYIVGYNAQDMVNGINTNDTDGELFSRNRYGDKRFKILCNVAIALATMEKKDNRKLFIQTGLPSSYVEGPDNNALKRTISKEAAFSMKVGNGNWRDFNIKVEMSNIDIIPQPTGSLYSVLIRNDGSYIPNAKEILCGNVLVMDVGFGTFDFYGIQNRAVICRESIDDIGMREVFAKTSKKIQKDTNEEIRVAALQRILETGKFECINEDDMSADEVSVSPYLKEANTEVLNAAMEKVKSVTNTFRGYKYIIVSGGTGEAWYEDIRKWLSNMKTLTVMQSNVNGHIPLIYSNARGYYLYRYNLNKR